MNKLHTLAALHETAANWYIRRQDRSWSIADETALQSWLDADPTHKAAYQRLDTTWQDFSNIARPQLASDTVAQPARQRNTSNHWLQRMLGTLRPVPTVLATCMLAAGGWFMYDNTPQYETQLQTTHTEMQALDLPDGSKIAVNIDSTVQIRYYPRKRDITLTQGEAYFQVHPDPDKPFIVTTSHSSVRVLGTTFNVQTSPAQLDVKVMEGKVDVRTNHNHRQHLVLTANQRVNIDMASGQHTLLPVQASTVGDWREGQLVWSSTPLIYVLQDLSRYLGHNVTLKEQRLGKLPVTGFASTAQPQQFLQALPDLLPVHIQRLADNSYQVSAR